MYHIKNDIRDNIFQNISRLSEDDIFKFKFTGPFNIGKSITLLEYSRTNRNAFYFNLKVWSNKDDRDRYIILQEEFSRVSKELFDDIQKEINSNYSDGKKPIDSLINIMKILSNSKNIHKFIFIFDQYKYTTFPLDLARELDKLDNKKIKFVYCSSINNKKMKDECIKTWKNLRENPKILSIVNQDYYFYYCHIYIIQLNNDVNVLNQIKKINRFRKYYTKRDSPTTIIKKTLEHISTKIFEFGKQVNISMDFLLTNLKSIINNKYDMNKIEKVLEFCPLKYFIIEFIETEFIIKIQFPFIRQIINRKLLEEEIYNYFKKEKYKKDLIENDVVKGYYFEDAVILGLKNSLKLPKAKIDYSIVLKEIATMNEICLNELDMNYLEKDKEEDIDDINDIINLNDLDIESIDEDKKCSDSNININKNENIIITNANKREKNKTKQKKNSVLDNMLKNFSIEEKKMSNEIEKTLEWYRFQEIKEIRRKKIEIKINNDYDGQKTFFLEQEKKKGRTLDCGLLFGAKKEKIFVGFQIKCYFEVTNSLPDNAKDKNIIKKNIKEILINSMCLLNCKITKWYYYLIFYLNSEPNKKEFNVNKALIEKNKNTLEILFFDPLKKKFFDVNLKEMNTLILTQKANLDTDTTNYQNVSMDLNPIMSSQINPFHDREESVESFLEDFSSYGNTEDEILAKLALKVNFGGILILKHKAPKLPQVIINPDFCYIFLYKRKNNGFIIAKSGYDEKKNPCVKYYDLDSGKEINYIENNCQYMYILKRKRTHNELKIIPGENEIDLSKYFQIQKKDN